MKIFFCNFSVIIDFLHRNLYDCKQMSLNVPLLSFKYLISFYNLRDINIVLIIYMQQKYVFICVINS